VEIKVKSHTITTLSKTVKKWHC